MSVLSKVFLLKQTTLFDKIAKLLKTNSLLDFRLTPFNFLILFTLNNRNTCTDSLINNKIVPSSKKFKFSVGRLEEVFLVHSLHINLADIKPAVQAMDIVDIPSIIDLKKNFVFLLSKGFSIWQLRETFVILLYSHDILLETFEELKSSCPFAREYRNENLKRHNENRESQIDSTKILKEDREHQKEEKEVRKEFNNLFKKVEVFNKESTANDRLLQLLLYNVAKRQRFLTGIY